MFYSYHRNPENAKKILEKLPIVTEEDIPASPEMDKFDFEVQKNHLADSFLSPIHLNLLSFSSQKLIKISDNV